jgi:thiol-disulfide isomerase/thioredoxin
VSPQPSKRNRRAEAAAERKRAAEVAAARKRRNRALLWGGLAAVVVIAVVVAVVAGGGSSANATKWETAAVTVDGTPLPTFDPQQSPDPAVGKTIPTLTGKSIYTGDPVTVTSKTDKPQAVIFVAHWCPHCQNEVPELVTLAKDGVFDGVDVTAVATSTNDQYPNYPPSAWLKKVGWPFPVMADSTTGTAAQAYGISAFPYFVLVNADGTVAGRATGELSSAQIRANISALKNGKSLPIASSSAASKS